MTDQPRTRQELYDRIRETSKEEFILEEMIRFGFWPAAGEIPEDPADEIRRMGEIRHQETACKIFVIYSGAQSRLSLMKDL